MRGDDLKKILFWTYAILIALLIVFKAFDSPLERIEALKELRRRGVDNVNLRPLYTIKMCLENIRTEWALRNLAGNTLPFFFLGALSKNTWDSNNFTFYIVSSVIITLEILQYVLFLGTCDIDDVILNVTFLKIGFL